MSTTLIFKEGLSSLLNSAIINIIDKSNSTDEALEVLKQHFTFTAAEIAQAFQESYIRALIAISTSLVSPEQGQIFWQKILKSPANTKNYQHLNDEYLHPFAHQHNLSTEALSKFCRIALQQSKLLIKSTIFEANNLPFTETELRSFVSANGTFAITNLVLKQIPIPLDEKFCAFLDYKELFGQAILLFLYEKLSQDIRMTNTLEALQHKGLIFNISDIKTLVKLTQCELNLADTEKNLTKLSELKPKLDNFQQIETIIQNYYANFINFQQNFANWTDLVTVQISSILSAIENLHCKENHVKKTTITQQILTVILSPIKKMLQSETSTTENKSLQISSKIEATVQIEAESESLKQVNNTRKWWDELDQQWQNIFQAAIGIKTKPTLNDLVKILDLHQLDCREKKISNLEPLRELKNLQVLDCSWNQILNLEPLSELKNLETLDCWKNKISDLEPLCELINLQKLVCSWNKISDLKPLRKLKNLDTLDCWKNKISDLEPLCELHNLQKLVCSLNKISDLEHLRNLSNLQILDCSLNQISNLEPLRELNNLQTLDCWKNKINEVDIEKFQKAMPCCKVQG
jgi:internalin A